jgi:flagellar basal body-associated protein FliL
MRPSEMVEGLDAVAKRSERHEQVERLKQRSGRIIMNEAVHVDEKGRTWQRIVLFSINGFVAAVAGLIIFLTWLANSSGMSTQESAANTNAMLAQYKNLAQYFEPTPAGKTLTVEEFKQKLTVRMNEQLVQRQKAMESAQPNRKMDAKEIRRAIRLLEMGLKFQDGYGKPYAIEAKGPGVFVIRSPSKGPSGETFESDVQVQQQAVTPESTTP